MRFITRQGRMAMLLAALTVAMIASGNVFAQMSWPCGETAADKVTATLNAEGVLTISGTGKMRGASRIEKIPIQEQQRAKQEYERCAREVENLIVRTTPNTLNAQLEAPLGIALSIMYKCGDKGGTERVVSTPMPWNEYMGGITEVIIGNGITSVGNGAFKNAGSLTSVNIGNSVASIGNEAFSYCENLKNVAIPNGVTSIGVQAFRNCKSLTSVTIPGSVISIEAAAFQGCSRITSVAIPNSVTTIGFGAFQLCEKLTSVNIGNGVKSIESKTFYNCKNLTSITIPNSVMSIGSEAFSGCGSLISITIGSNVSTIGEKETIATFV